jgi:hypothetical protein
MGILFAGIAGVDLLTTALIYDDLSDPRVRLIWLVAWAAILSAHLVTSLVIWAALEYGADQATTDRGQRYGLVLLLAAAASVGDLLVKTGHSRRRPGPTREWRTPRPPR